MESAVGTSFVVRRAAEQLTSPLIPAPRGVWSSARRGEVDGSSFFWGGSAGRSRGGQYPGAHQLVCASVS